jgi:serine protease AprX
MVFLMAATQTRRGVRTFWRLAFGFTVLAGALVAGPGVGAQHRARLSTDLLFHESRRTAERTRVIVHGTRDEVTAIARRHGVSVLRWLGDGAVLRVDGRQLAALAADRVIDHLSGDPEVRPSMAVAIKSTGADLTWAGSGGLLGIGGIPGVTGQGIGVAVIDSGITVHNALKGKVVASVSMLANDPSTADEYGHGTHVAGIIAGARTSTTSLYPSGIAPGVQLINVRVLGDNGAGFTSDVIAGIDWVIQNRTRYNIRVINLSLGHPVMEPALTDPLCEAVRRAVSAGIVVVAAAGNAGQTDAGVPIMGGILSPGNSPYAITVGAVDTKGTTSRGDDSVAPYSSRGPTKFDSAVKPDLVAPGSRLVSLEALNAYLPTTYPVLHRAGVGNNAYMQLTGTSMAAPVVTGAAALLLQGTPSLTTAHVKMALQAGATPIEDSGLMGAGAGSLNIWASRQIATKGLSSLLNSVTGLLGSLLENTGGAFFWDAGTLAHRIYTGSGLRLLGLLDLSKLWSSPNGVKFGDLNLAGLLNPLASLPRNYLIWGDVAVWAANDEIIWGTNDEIIWGTNDQDEIIWGTSIHDPSGDEIIWGTSGDDEIIWGTTVLTEP